MLRSLFSGITGLRAHQTMLDVTSNNIANVNTTGYKSSSTVFADTLSQLMSAAGTPTSTSGGTNPMQIGLGVQVSGIKSNFTQGSAQTTGVQTDLMIQGDGFFIVNNDGMTQYTRAGSFSFDSTGNLVNPSGMLVQGYPATNGVVNPNAALQTINVPSTSIMPPQTSTTVTVAGNITAGAAGPLTLTPTVYDPSGAAHAITVQLDTPVSSASGTLWNVTLLDDTGASIGTGTLNYLTDGTYDTSNTALSFSIPGYTPATTVALDLTGTSEYGGSQTLAVSQVDGYTAGTLSSVQVANNGDVVGVYSNGQRLTMARVAVATFNNPSGLERAGDTTYVQTNNSGLPVVTTPGSGSGSLLSSTLEMSNVDLGTEFTNLIIAQRGFQANSKVISTSDSVLEELVNLKR